MTKVAPTLRGAGITPACPKCRSNKSVRRMWRGRMKMWYCDACFIVTSTKKKEATLMQRITHRLPEPDTFRYSDVMPNRKARRAQRGRSA